MGVITVGLEAFQMPFTGHIRGERFPLAVISTYNKAPDKGCMALQFIGGIMPSVDVHGRSVGVYTFPPGPILKSIQHN